MLGTTTCSLPPVLAPHAVSPELCSAPHSVGTIILGLTSSHPVVTARAPFPRLHPHGSTAITSTSRPQIHSVAPSFRWNNQKLAQQPLCQLNENPRTRGAFGNKKTVYLSQICAESDGMIYPHFLVKRGHMNSNRGKWLGKPSYQFFSAIYRGVTTPYNNSFHGAFGY